MNVRRLLLITVASFFWEPTSLAQVSFERILDANKEPENWLTYSGTPLSQRHSLLNQITPANVKNLGLQWIYQARSLQKFEATPLLVDGVMYTVQAPNDVIALDAATGRIFGSTPTIREEHTLVAAGSIADWPFSVTRSSWEPSTRIWSRSMPRTDDHSGTPRSRERNLVMP